MPTIKVLVLRVLRLTDDGTEADKNRKREVKKKSRAHTETGKINRKPRGHQTDCGSVYDVGDGLSRHGKIICDFSRIVAASSAASTYRVINGRPVKSKID